MNKIYYIFFIVFFSNINYLKPQNNNVIKIKLQMESGLKHFLINNYFEQLKNKFGMRFQDTTESKLILELRYPKDKSVIIINIANNQLPKSSRKYINMLILNPDYTAQIEKVSPFILAMLLEVDTSIYSKITTFDEELLKYLPDTARERHAHHYFCITKKDYVRGNEFCRKNFSNPHYDWANPNSVVAVTQVNCYTFNYQTCKDNYSICMDYDDENLQLDCLSNYLQKHTNITTIRLRGKWDTKNVDRFKDIIELKNIIKIIINRYGGGSDQQENDRVQILINHFYNVWNVKKQIKIVDFVN